MQHVMYWFFRNTILIWENFLAYVPGDSQFRRLLFFSHTPTPFSRHYRTRIHDTAPSFRFFCRCYLLFCSFPYLRLARLFRAYLRGTYLPGLSGNLTPAPSPERSPCHFNSHPPTHMLVQNYLSRFPTSACTFTTCRHRHTYTHVHYIIHSLLTDGGKLCIILTFVRSRYFSCRYMRIYLLIMSCSDFILRELPQNLFYIKIQNFFIFHFFVWREKDYANC